MAESPAAAGVGRCSSGGAIGSPPEVGFDGATAAGGAAGAGGGRFGAERHAVPDAIRLAMSTAATTRVGDIGGLPRNQDRSDAREGEGAAGFRGSSPPGPAEGYPRVCMPRTLRALILFLAVLPAIWGTCPGWITGACCCAPKGAATAKAPCCPLCRERDEKSRRAPCTHCPCTMARNGSTPAPASVDAPAADLTVVAPVASSDASPVARSIRCEIRVDIRPPGGPPDLVGIVVLLV